MLKAILAAAISLAVMPAIAGPMINVGELNEYIQPKQNTLAKRINNTGDATAFVRVSVDEMIFTGSGYTENKLDANALIKGSGTGLISSPARLIIPAKGMQSNRLVFTGSRDKERYYRVRYIPVIPEDAQEFGLSKDEAKKYQNEISAGVTVLTGFGTIVTVLPASARFDTQITENNRSLQISNNGNASIVIHSLKECDKGLKNCSSVTNHQLRPGMKLEKPVNTGKVWQYTLYEGTQKKSLSSGSTY
ncbi:MULTISPECIES: hypothetical protein [Pantoea]|uniref:Pilus assembly protein n=1 Tax=Candidatus Pantoea communis TaxID=2608354 RepID=A0ABX0RVS9_9GAMM|nr:MULTISPECIES: hypothetical protein [Pantoea]NIG21612.1 hypothetical protein [Pantoea communis]